MPAEQTRATTDPLLANSTLRPSSPARSATFPRILRQTEGLGYGPLPRRDGGRFATAGRAGCVRYRDGSRRYTAYALMRMASMSSISFMAARIWRAFSYTGVSTIFPW